MLVDRDGGGGVAFLGGGGEVETRPACVRASSGEASPRDLGGLAINGVRSKGAVSSGAGTGVLACLPSGPGPRPVPVAGAEGAGGGVGAGGGGSFENCSPRSASFSAIPLG